MWLTRGVEFVYGVVAFIAFLITIRELAENTRQRRRFDRVGINGNRRRYLIHGTGQIIYDNIGQLMMMLAASAALAQNYLSGHHPHLASTLILALTIAEFCAVGRIVRRRQYRPRVFRALERLEAKEHEGES